MTRERRVKETPTTVAKFQSENSRHRLSDEGGLSRQTPMPAVDCPAIESRRTRCLQMNSIAKAKMLGGWYSSFKKSNAGFQFLGGRQGRQVLFAVNGDADRTDVLEARKERKELTAANVLHELCHGTSYAG